MQDSPTLHVVHCIDTEGPLVESLENTFDRLQETFGISLPPTKENLKALQNKEVPLKGMENAVAKMVAPELIQYNESWEDIGAMLEEALSPEFREKIVDDFGGGWVYSWHVMDHMGYTDNPRQKKLGYGVVFKFYKEILERNRSLKDEINWHFHPLSFFRSPLQCATSYVNSYDVLIQILCRRVIEEHWFPVVNRPGFHSERPDSHAFLEQWIPFDYANQYYEEKKESQPDLANGRFGDWRRASPSWAGYHPSHDDYQLSGDCRRWIFRCLNVGTRTRQLKEFHIQQAFEESIQKGSAILAFADHDYRDLRPDVDYVRGLLSKARKDFPNVRIQFSGAGEAARQHAEHLTGKSQGNLKLSAEINKNCLSIKVIEGELFGPQPFLAIKTVDGQYFHDNLDIQEPKKIWRYVFDEHTVPREKVATIGVAGAGIAGNFSVVQLNPDNRDS